MEKIVKHRKGNWVVEFDVNEPHTPCMVYLMAGRHIVDHGTFWFARDTGELSENGTPLPYSVADWLDSLSDEADAIESKARENHPDYR